MLYIYNCNRFLGILCIIKTAQHATVVLQFLLCFSLENARRSLLLVLSLTLCFVLLTDVLLVPWQIFSTPQCPLLSNQILEVIEA